MNLLVVGNGFDLAHKLPTRYSDFLDFMSLYIDKVYDWRFNWQMFDEELHKLEYSALDNILADLKQFPKFNAPVKKIFYDCTSLPLIGEREFYINDWLMYLLCVYSYRRSLENPKYMWIDIEEEIKKLLMQLDKTDSFFRKKTRLSVLAPYKSSNDNKPKTFYFNSLFSQINRVQDIPDDKLKGEMINFLFRDLERLECLLKFYLNLVQSDFHMREKKFFNINTNFPYSIMIDHFISFNYTNISTIYLSEEQKSNIHYVNGDLGDDSKIILGFENHDSNKTYEFCNNNIDSFCKTSQRVNYNMDYEYKKWIRICHDETYEKINTYIIGHSFALSDKQILLDIIKQSDNVTIYCHSKDDNDNGDRQSKIANLKKILGENEFLECVNNPVAKPCIRLKSQKEIEL